MKFINKHIQILKTYKVPEIEEGEIKIDAMENPYSFSAEVVKKIQAAIENVDFNRYPDPNYPSLKSKLADYTDLTSEHVLVGNGSDELILALYLACGGPGRKALAPSPTFSMYKILAELSSTEYISIPLEKDFSLPVNKIISQQADMIFITYPNNPTANSFDRLKIKDLLENSNSLVVIDEAYYEFSEKSFADEIDNYKNLLILRTFSKAFGLAGIRAGYMLSNPELIQQIRKVQMPYNLSSVNQKILETVVSDRENILKTVELIKKSKEKLYERLNNIKGLQVYPSDANFILIKFADIKTAVESLKSAKICVKEFSEEELKDCLRITVGTEQENAKLLEVFENIF